MKKAILSKGITKPISVIIALTMMVALLPTFMLTVNAATVQVGDTAALLAAINNANDGVPTIIEVTNDFVVDELITIPANKIITITSDNGLHTLMRGVSGNLITVNFGAILVLENVIVDGNKDGGFGPCDDNCGDGVCWGICHTNLVVNNGSLEINNGAVLQNNNGRGVMSSGTFTMTDGEISNNTHGREHGGGVSFNGSFDMLGGKIINNSAINGGGVNVASGTFTMGGTAEISGNHGIANVGGVNIIFGGSFIMNGGIITANTAGSNDGGTAGVSVGVSFGISSLFIMNDGEISNNFGTGVSVSGAFDFNGGEISSNTNGVSIAHGTMNMNNGKIVNNGIGVSINSSLFPADEIQHRGSFYMTGGEISGNVFGVHVSNFIEDDYTLVEGLLSLGGTSTIVDNSFNVFMQSGMYITLGTDINAPTIGMNVGVTTATVNGVFVESGAISDHVQYFFSDNSTMKVIHDNEQLKIVDDCNDCGSITCYICSAWDGIVRNMEQLISEIAVFNSGIGNRTITIGADFTITSQLNLFSSNTLTIKSVDGENHILNRGVSGNLITLNSFSRLTLENITFDGDKEGDFSTDGGGSLIFVDTFSRLEMKDGAVLQNNITSFGGGVRTMTFSTFIMTGGKITNNKVILDPGDTSSGYGGGVDARGMFLMSGGEISDNENGSGIFVFDGLTIMSDNAVVKGNSGSGVGINGDGTFIMSGGEISGNYSEANGGGVFVYSGEFIMSDGIITDNIAKFGGGVSIHGDNTWNDIGGSLSIGGIAVITDNFDENGNANNVFLYPDKYITLLTNESAPSLGMEIGIIKSANNGVFVESDATEEHVQYFNADQVGKKVIHDNGQLIIVDDICNCGICEDCNPITGCGDCGTCEECNPVIGCGDCGTCEDCIPIITDCEHNWGQQGNDGWRPLPGGPFFTRTCILCGLTENREQGNQGNNNNNNNNNAVIDSNNRLIDLGPDSPRPSAPNSGNPQPGERRIEGSANNNGNNSGISGTPGQIDMGPGSPRPSGGGGGANPQPGDRRIERIIFR
jgi:hypothetical protein